MEHDSRGRRDTGQVAPHAPRLWAAQAGWDARWRPPWGRVDLRGVSQWRRWTWAIDPLIRRRDRTPPNAVTTRKPSTLGAALGDSNPQRTVPQAIIRRMTDTSGHPELPPLYYASIANDLAEVRRLLEAGADPNDGESIYHAAEKNHRAVLDLLKAHGGDFSLRHPHWTNTPLYFLAGFGEDEGGEAAWHKGVAYLLEQGADPNVTSYDVDETPLHKIAASGGNAATARLLLEYGANPRGAERARQDAVRPGRAHRQCRRGPAACRAWREHGPGARRRVPGGMPAWWRPARTRTARAGSVTGRPARDRARLRGHAAALGRLARTGAGRAHADCSRRASQHAGSGVRLLAARLGRAWLPALSRR